MLDRAEYMPLQYMVKQRWSGSYSGMRFLFQKQTVEVNEKTEEVLEVIYWKEPYSYECTAEDEKTRQQFPLTEEGREAAITWLEEEYAAQEDEMRAACRWNWEK